MYGCDAFVVRVVDAPHDVLDPHFVPEIALERAQEARADVTLPVPVLARAQRHVFRGTRRRRTLPSRGRTSCGRRSCRARASVSRTHFVPLSVLQKCRFGVPLEHAREDEVPQRAVRPPGDLEHEHRGGRGRVHAEVGAPPPLWWLHRHLVRLAGRPDGLVLGRVQREEARAGRSAREHDAARAGCAPPPTRSRRPSPRRRPGRSGRTRRGARAPATRSRRASGCGPAGPPSGARRRRPSGGASSWLRAIGANGGCVLGKITSATQPSASCSRRRRSLFQLRSASVSGSPSTPTDFFMPRPFIISRIMREPSSIDAAHTSKSSWYFDSRYG